MVESIRRRFRPTIKVSRKEGITTYVEESAALRAGRKAAEVGGRIGSDVNEMLRIVPWKRLLKDRTVQTLVATGIVIAAARNQEVELPTAQTIFRPQEPTQPPVEAPVSPEAAAISQPLSYTVQKEDTLFSLAQRFGVTVEALMEANGITNRDLIHAGNNLIIPGRGTTETVKGDRFRKIVGNPETSGITEEDILFLQWLNAKQLWWEDWTGRRQTIVIPIDPYRYAKTVEEAGGPEWNVMLGLGATETGYFPGSLWEAHTESYADAVGTMQILKENFEYFAPYPGGYIYDPKYNFLTGGNLASYLGLDASLSEKEFMDIFLGKGPTRRVWNRHLEQARRAHRIAKALEGQRQQFKREYQQKID